MADDIQTIIIGDSANAALLTKCVNNFAIQQRNYSGGVPASPAAHQTIVDTTTTPDSYKIRNAANSAYVTLFPDITATGGGLAVVTAGAFTTAAPTSAVAATTSTHLTRKGEVDARVRASASYVGTLTASDNKYLLVAGTGWTIIDVGIVSETGVASHATDLWTFNVRNLTAAVNLRSAVKTTNGAAITADTYYALGLDQNLTPASGDVLQLQIVYGGSAGPLTETLAVLRYTYATP